VKTFFGTSIKTILHGICGRKSGRQRGLRDLVIPGKHLFSSIDGGVAMQKVDDAWKTKVNFRVNGSGRDSLTKPNTIP
jgi:hypothetical protein